MGDGNSPEHRGDADTFQGETVFARGGDKVGNVDKVLYDKATGKPERFTE